MKKIKYILSSIVFSLMAIACSQDIEMEGQGYLIIKLNTVTSTQKPSGTRADAPSDYNAKQLRVEIKDAQGNIVKSTNDFDNDQNFIGDIALNPGEYTVVAHSYNWDGNGSGFNAPYYYGTSKKVNVVEGSRQKVQITCTQANVKVTVNYDKSFVENFTSAITNISSAVNGVTPLQFVMGSATTSGYFPVGNLIAKLKVVNKSGVENEQTDEITGVKARDHYILNYKVAESGNLGDGTEDGFKVTVDESTNTYTYTFEVPQKMGTEFAAKGANAWSTFAMLTADITSKTQSFQESGITLQWKVSGAEDWNDVANAELTIADEKIKYTLKELSPQTSYEYRINYKEGDNEVTSNVIKFTTEKQIALYNGGFENWWMDGKVAYATERGVSYWDTSNAGAASFGGSNTTETTSVVHSGNKAAKLESKYIVIKFAAASLYTGSFIELVGTNGAKLNWGVPFTARPTALKGFMQYAPVNVNRVSSSAPSSAPAKGNPDVCGMYCALLTESLIVDNTKMSTFPDWENDDRVVAYGSLPDAQNVHSNNQWKEVNIPLVYRDLTKKPTHLLVVFSASKYGDYFHGGEGSTLYLDDFGLVYGDEPAVK